MVPPASYGIPRAPQYSGYGYVFLDLMYGTFTPYGQLSQNCSTILLESFMPFLNPKDKSLVWPLSISLAATLKIDNIFLFLALLRCFSSGGSLLISYVFTYG